MSNSTTDAVERIASAPEHAARCHEAAEFQKLDSLHQSTEAAPIPQGDSRRGILIAIDFLGGWVDASNHNWRYYDGIAKEDWPNLARYLAFVLRRGEKVEMPVILTHFDASIRQPLLWPFIRKLLHMR